MVKQKRKKKKRIEKVETKRPAEITQQSLRVYLHVNN